MIIYHKLLRWFCFVLLGSIFCLCLQLTSGRYYFNNNYTINYKTNNNFHDSIHDSIKGVVLDFISDVDSLQDINIRLLEELILRHQYINKAEVYLDVEGTMEIDIYFRQPFVRVLKNNKVFYFDINGVSLPSLLKVDKSLLVINGDLRGELLTKTMSLVKKIYDEPFLNSLIGGVHYDKNEGYILSAKACDLSIYVGHNPIINVDMINLFYDFILANLTCDYCHSINITYDKQIICINE